MFAKGNFCCLNHIIEGYTDEHGIPSLITNLIETF